MKIHVRVFIFSFCVRVRVLPLQTMSLVEGLHDHPDVPGGDDVSQQACREETERHDTHISFVTLYAGRDFMFAKVHFILLLLFSSCISTCTDLSHITDFRQISTNNNC